MPAWLIIVLVLLNLAFLLVNLMVTSLVLKMYSEILKDHAIDVRRYRRGATRDP